MPSTETKTFNCSRCGKQRVSPIWKSVKLLEGQPICRYCTRQVFNPTFTCCKCGKQRVARSKRALQQFEQNPENVICEFCIMKTSHDETCLKRYGKTEIFALENVKKKIERTNLERYGTKFPSQTTTVKEKMKQTCLKRYGKTCSLQRTEIQEKLKEINLKRYNVPFAIISDESLEKSKQTRLERYGVEYLMQAKEFRKKSKTTLKQNFGTDCTWNSSKIQEKSKTTMQKRYGVNYTWQSFDFREKSKQTCLEKYGVEYYSQSKEMQSKRKQAYRHDDANFDSKPELAFYIYCKDHELEIKRNTQEFLYEFQGKIHRYFPDFVVNEELVEIKGDQFLNEATGTWQNPFNHSQDMQYEAKHQCAIQNNVKILYSEDYQKCIDYVIEKYGRDFFEKCKS